MSSTFIKEFKNNSSGHQELLNNTDYKVIGKEIINSEKKHNLEFKIYCAATEKCEDELLLKLMKFILPKLNRDQLSMLEMQNFYSKLTIELPKKSVSFVTNIAQLCAEFIMLGDPRAMFWKDIFPVCINIIEKQSRVDSKTGKEFKKNLIKDILDAELPHQNAEVVTAIVSMFK
jgi:FANCI solenoid 1